MRLFLIGLAGVASSLIFLGCKANVYFSHETRGEFEERTRHVADEHYGRVGAPRMKPYPKDVTGN